MSVAGMRNALLKVMREYFFSFFTKILISSILCISIQAQVFDFQESREYLNSGREIVATLQSDINFVRAYFKLKFSRTSIDSEMQKIFAPLMNRPIPGKLFQQLANFYKGRAYSDRYRQVLLNKFFKEMSRRGLLADTQLRDLLKTIQSDVYNTSQILELGAIWARAHGHRVGAEISDIAVTLYYRSPALSDDIKYIYEMIDGEIIIPDYLSKGRRKDYYDFLLGQREERGSFSYWQDLLVVRPELAKFVTQAVEISQENIDYVFQERQKYKKKWGLLSDDSQFIATAEDDVELVKAIQEITNKNRKSFDVYIRDNRNFVTLSERTQIIFLLSTGFGKFPTESVVMALLFLPDGDVVRHAAFEYAKSNIDNQEEFKNVLAALTGSSDLILRAKVNELIRDHRLATFSEARVVAYIKDWEASHQKWSAESIVVPTKFSSPFKPSSSVIATNSVSSRSAKTARPNLKLVSSNLNTSGEKCNSALSSSSITEK